MSTSMQQRRGTAEQWAVGNPILRDGEIGIDKDSGIIKIGDGGTAWANLPVALNSQYLPILGKAADADKLDGLDSSVNATVNTVAVRNSAGRLAAIRASGTGELTTLGQVNELTAASKLETVSRTITASDSLIGSDQYKVLQVSANSGVPVVTLPTDDAENISIGAWVDIKNINVAPILMGTAAGVSLELDGYKKFVLLRGDTLRLLKSSANSWIALDGVRDTLWMTPADAGFTFNAGWSEGGDLVRFRLRNGIVYIKCHIARTGATAGSGAVVGRIPSDLAPSSVQWFTWLKYGGIAYESKVAVNGDLIAGITVEQNSGFVGVGSYPRG